MKDRNMRKIKTKPDVKEQKLARLQEALEVIREARRDLEATNDPTASLPDQLLHWFHVRQHYEVVKQLATEAEAFSRHLSYEQLPSAFRSSRVNARSITLDGVGRFSLGSRTTAKVIDQQHANEFLRNNGKGDALREMVPSTTLNSIVAELLRQGVEPMRERDGIEAATYSYTSFTRE
jgi:hypothetical protein